MALLESVASLASWVILLITVLIIIEIFRILTNMGVGAGGGWLSKIGDWANKLPGGTGPGGAGEGELKQLRDSIEEMKRDMTTRFNGVDDSVSEVYRVTSHIEELSEHILENTRRILGYITQWIGYFDKADAVFEGIFNEFEVNRKVSEENRESLGEISKKLETFDDAFKEISKNITESAAELETKIGEVDKNVGDLSKEIADIKKNTESLLAQGKTLEDNIKKLPKKISVMFSSRMTTIMKKIEALSADTISKVEGKIKEIDTNTKTVINQKIGLIKTQITNQMTNFTTIVNKGVATINTSVQEVNSNVETKIDAGLKNYKSAFGKINKELKGIHEDIERHASAVNAINVELQEQTTLIRQTEYDIKHAMHDNVQSAMMELLHMDGLVIARREDLLRDIKKVETNIYRLEKWTLAEAKGFQILEDAVKKKQNKKAYNRARRIGNYVRREYRRTNIKEIADMAIQLDNLVDQKEVARIVDQLIIFRNSKIVAFSKDEKGLIKELEKKKTEVDWDKVNKKVENVKKIIEGMVLDETKLIRMVEYGRDALMQLKSLREL